ncbi:MAG: ABC transporter permease [Clostridia bacterium]|nr:ABC transporter permease [Clostridia bacterium]
MLKYTIKRILLLIPTLLIVLTIVFCLMKMIPGSPVYAMVQGEDYTPEEIYELETQLGFHDPIYEQYWRYISGVFQGDWGKSYYNNRPVFQNIISVWEPAILMTVCATLITVFIAIPVGVISATKRNSFLDYFVSTSSMVSMTIPTVCWGLLLCYFLAYKLNLFPILGYTYIAKGGFWTSLYCIALPSISLGLHHVASLARLTRSTMLDVLNQDYIRTAKAKGLPSRKIYYKHALKNTLSLVATNIAVSFAGMLGGSAVTERVFGIHSLGTLAVNSLSNRDYSQEQAIVLFTALICLVVNLLLDLFYKFLDPRIQYD